MRKYPKRSWVGLLAIASALWDLGSMTAAQAGIFGALNDIANAAQDSGANVPNSVYEAGSVAQNLNDAAQQAAPVVAPAPQANPTPSCPPGYVCTPKTPPPVCPPGEVCTPVAAPSAAVATPPPSGTGNLPGLDYPVLPQEQEHQANPNYIRFVMPTQAFVSAHDPRIETMGNPGSTSRKDQLGYRVTCSIEKLQRNIQRPE